MFNDDEDFNWGIEHSINYDDYTFQVTITNLDTDELFSSFVVPANATTRRELEAEFDALMQLSVNFLNKTPLTIN